MVSESQLFDRIVVMIKQLSPQYRLKLMEVLMQTLWEILPPKIEAKPQQTEWQADFFEQTAGAWKGEKLIRPEQGEYEVRLELL